MHRTPRLQPFAGSLFAAVLLAAFSTAPAAAVSIHIDTDIDGAEIEIEDDDVLVVVDGAEARISPAGELFVDGRRVRVGERDQRDLVRYNSGMHWVEDHAIDLGLQGAGLAVSALGEAFAAVLTGDEKRAERRIEARADQLENDARELCDELRRIERIQNRLAANVTHFRPFAILELDDDDCVVDED
jgi:hypothetical protein